MKTITVLSTKRQLADVRDQLFIIKQSSSIIINYAMIHDDSILSILKVVMRNRGEKSPS